MSGDDEALTWDEVSDPTHVDSPPAKPASKTPAEPSEPAQSSESIEPAAAASPATSSFLLVTYGIIGGAVLLYTIGWVLGIEQVTLASNDVLSDITSVVAQILAIAAPVAWMAGAFVLTRGAKPIVRLLVLLAGLIVTLPLPFVLLGAS
jgi:hypothetical protein